MKKVALTALGVLVFVLGCLLFVGAAAPKTARWDLERRMPDVAGAANLYIVQLSSERPERIALPLGLRIRQFLFPPPPPPAGFQEHVLAYLVTSGRNSPRFHCLVRITDGKVARIAVQYPKAAKGIATAFHNALRQTFPADRISLDEVNGT
jgi:hypothetical protein